MNFLPIQAWYLILMGKHLYDRCIYLQLLFLFGYPKPIDDEQFPGLEVFRTRIVAALNQTQTEVLFFLLN